MNHIDGNKLNIRVSNLEWATQSENLIHAYKFGLKRAKIGCEHPSSKFTEEQIEYIRKVCIPGDREFGIRALARKFGIDDTSIYNIYYRKTYKNVT